MGSAPSGRATPKRYAADAYRESVFTRSTSQAFAMAALSMSVTPVVGRRPVSWAASQIGGLSIARGQALASIDSITVGIRCVGNALAPAKRHAVESETGA